MLLCILNNVDHHLQRFQRIFALGSLAGEHYRIRSVVNSICHVRYFRTGRTRIADHGIQHLGCRDDCLEVCVALLDHHFLQIRNLLGRDLHAKVASGHHDAVRRTDDLIDIVDPFRILDLRDDRRIGRAKFLQEGLDLKDALRISHE